MRRRFSYNIGGMKLSEYPIPTPRTQPHALPPNASASTFPCKHTTKERIPLPLGLTLDRLRAPPLPICRRLQHSTTTAPDPIPVPTPRPGTLVAPL